MAAAIDVLRVATEVGGMVWRLISYREETFLQSIIWIPELNNGLTYGSVFTKFLNHDFPEI